MVVHGQNVAASQCFLHGQPGCLDPIPAEGQESDNTMDMYPMDEKEARRLKNKLREAAFSYFLWSLPVRTPPTDVVMLADELATMANRMAVEYFHSKGIPDEHHG
jgi:hypothetical protein